jgi:hypothetical protein
MHPYALKKTYALIPHILSPCSEKDISLYKDITVTTGLVQQPDKIVVRFTHTDLSLFVMQIYLSYTLLDRANIPLFYFLVFVDNRRKMLEDLAC